MYSRLILYLIYLVLCFHFTWACAYFPKLTESSNGINGFLNGLPDQKYSFTKDEVDGFFAPVKYHPTVFLQKYTIMEAPLNSACIKCGICLAISEKLEHILRFALKSSISLQDFDGYLSSRLLRPICDFAFQRWTNFVTIFQIISFFTLCA